MEVMEIAGKDPLRAPISLALEMRSFGAFWSIWDVRSKEGLGAWTQLNWIRKGEGGSHLEDQLTPTRPAKFNSIELRSQSQTRKMLLPP
ncbi:unnamed protein product [Microthlaspi erraticum]|uniref:Uncharacterized protein n=1 Tax=Microthlaspi erraticum TaxID=1685480 RepID=A0A6D2JQ78_9BRAS|nr:unnamed protein product [Microthlaspi erraticum]